MSYLGRNILYPGFVLPVRIKYSELSQRGEINMAQNKNNSKKNDLESAVEKERMRIGKILERLDAKILQLASERNKLIGCLISIKKKLSSEEIPINNLITEIVKTLQEVNNDKI